MDAGLPTGVEEADGLAGAAGFAEGGELLGGTSGRGRNTVGIRFAAKRLGEEELFEGQTAVL